MSGQLSASRTCAVRDGRAQFDVREEAPCLLRTRRAAAQVGSKTNSKDSDRDSTAFRSHTKDTISTEDADANLQCQAHQCPRLTPLLMLLVGDADSDPMARRLRLIGIGQAEAKENELRSARLDLLGLDACLVADEEASDVEHTDSDPGCVGPLGPRLTPLMALVFGDGDADPRARRLRLIGLREEGSKGNEMRRARLALLGLMPYYPPRHFEHIDASRGSSEWDLESI